MWIDRPFTIGKLHAPDVFSRFDAMHAHLSRFGTPRIAYPDYAEPGFLLAMLDANDIAFLAHVLDSGDSGPGAGNVYGACLAGERAPDAVHSPNADGEFGRRPVIKAASHG
jgi:hypothetical protein